MTLPRKLLFVIVCIVLLAGFFWWVQRERTLADLERELDSAPTGQGRAKVIELLQDYYLKLAIPDSISQRVDREVTSLLGASRDKVEATDFTLSDNPYETENRLAGLITTALILRVQGDTLRLIQTFDQVSSLAAEVDSAIGSHYWVNFVQEARTYTSDQASAWLRANRALILCDRIIDKDYIDSEKYGAFCLQSMAGLSDERLRQSVYQRLQYILYQYRGLTELSLALAEVNLESARSIQNHLRAAGVLFHQAAAYKEMGRIDAALEMAENLITMTETYKDVPFIEVYRKRGLLLITDPYWRLGRYQEALAICEQIGDFTLTAGDSMYLHNMRGLVHQRLGYYDVAESEYKIALRIADRTNQLFNKIQYRRNIASMYQNLAEYDKAFEYYRGVTELLKRSELELSEHFVSLFMNSDFEKMIEAPDGTALVTRLIAEARRLVNRSSGQPLQQAGLYLTMGQLYRAAQNFKDALRCFSKAEAICESGELDILGLETKIKVSQMLLELQRPSEAVAKAREVLKSAKKKNELERVIDSLALLARIEDTQGKLKQAIDTSRKLAAATMEFGSRFENLPHLTSFHHKIYDYLKQSVTYEIQLNRVDSAFVWLDFAKSRIARSGARSDHSPAKALELVNPKGLASQLEKNSLLIDYLVMPDTLYVFTMANSGVQLFRKALHKDHLESSVREYRERIDTSIDILSNFAPQSSESHYAATTALSHQLFIRLLGWPKLRSLLEDKDVLYLVPDEFLFEVPFSTLVMDTTEDVTFLIDQVAIVNSASSSLFLSEKERHIPKAVKERALVSIDRDFLGAEEVLQSAKQVFPHIEQLVIAGMPTKDKVLEKLSREYGIIIIIGHAVANVVEPDHSYIEFGVASDSTTYHKVQLTVADLKKIDWSRAEMVMLVGCESAVGKLYRGSGIAGLPQSFVNLGAKIVLATNWRIDAGYAIPQIKSFMEEWLRSSDPSQTLRKVQLKFIQELQRDRYLQAPHPYYWGSYNLLCQNHDFLKKKNGG